MRGWRKVNKLTEEQKIKNNSRSYAGVYKRRGKLCASSCVDCGKDEVEMHHEDYSKPLQVVWICRDCHMVRHKT